MCKRYGGFLRVALADPLPERRWFRRGWVTFRREVNIKDICWNLNNIRVSTFVQTYWFYFGLVTIYSTVALQVSQS